MVVEQVYIFLATILVGAVMGIVFDFFRALRRNGNTCNIIVYLQDIIFWLIVAVIIITSSFVLNNGELRGYMLIGYVLGAFIYMLTLSKYIKSFFGFILDLISNGLQILCKPFNMVSKSFQKKEENLKSEQEF